MSFAPTLTRAASRLCGVLHIWSSPGNGVKGEGPVAGTYAYTPDVWPPLAADVFLAVLARSGRRGNVPVLEPFVAPAIEIAWHKVQSAVQLAVG